MKSVDEIERDLLRDIVGDVTKWHAGAANVSEVGLLRSMLYDMVRNHAELTYRLADVQETAEHSNKLLREAVDERDVQREVTAHTKEALADMQRRHKETSQLIQELQHGESRKLAELQRKYNELAMQVESTRAERDLARRQVCELRASLERERAARDGRHGPHDD
jgi:septal ring factor EnvC (AmiA/AmiB activator)